jgi:hypothetical protein
MVAVSILNLRNPTQSVIRLGIDLDGSKIKVGISECSGIIVDVV